MKLTGEAGAAQLVLTASTGAYLVRFQDLSLGRLYVNDAVVDGSGVAKLDAPPNFGLQSYAASVVALNTGKVNYLVNRTTSDELVFTDEPVAQPASVTIQPPDKTGA